MTGSNFSPEEAVLGLKGSHAQAAQHRAAQRVTSSAPRLGLLQPCREQRDRSTHSTITAWGSLQSLDSASVPLSAPAQTGKSSGPQFTHL